MPENRAGEAPQARFLGQGLSACLHRIEYIGGLGSGGLIDNFRFRCP
jgi:hypothetical protein